MGVKLFLRKNRSFELTEAGKYFYRKSLLITSDLKQLSMETLQIYKKDFGKLFLGVLSTYSGEEFNLAISKFSEKYPKVEISVISGNHEELYNALSQEKVDLVLNDQRRIFSDEYENIILSETYCCVELAIYNSLSKRASLSVEELKNILCILVASKDQMEEERFYRDVIGFRGEFLFADTLQAAKVMVISNRGIMPVEGNSSETTFKDTVKRIPLLRGKSNIKRVYCAFYKKNRVNYYVEEFGEILRACFHSHK